MSVKIDGLTGASRVLSSEVVPFDNVASQLSAINVQEALDEIESLKLDTSSFLNSNVSLATNGYQKLPSGLIIQWGYVSATTSVEPQSVAFPIAFPNSCMNVLTQITVDASTSYDVRYFSVSSMSKTGFTTYYTVTRYYIAIGY